MVIHCPAVLISDWHECYARFPLCGTYIRLHLLSLQFWEIRGRATDINKDSGQDSESAHTAERSMENLDWKSGVWSPYSPVLIPFLIIFKSLWNQSTHRVRTQKTFTLVSHLFREWVQLVSYNLWETYLSQYRVPASSMMWV
jgi:hypothetical protein